MVEQPKLRKRIFVGFAGTVTIGLSLAGWYVSSRILVAARPPSIIKVELPPPPPPSTPVEVVVPTPKRVDPRPGEVYLQLAAMGPHAMEDYLKELAGKGIRPLIAPGPSETIQRMLMGPYANERAWKKAQDELSAQGIQSMVRPY